MTTLELIPLQKSRIDHTARFRVPKDIRRAADFAKTGAGRSRPACPCGSRDIGANT